MAKNRLTGERADRWYESRGYFLVQFDDGWFWVPQNEIIVLEDGSTIAAKEWANSGKKKASGSGKRVGFPPGHPVEADDGIGKAPIPLSTPRSTPEPAITPEPPVTRPSGPVPIDRTTNPAKPPREPQGWENASRTAGGRAAESQRTTPSTRGNLYDQLQDPAVRAGLVSFDVPPQLRGGPDMAELALNMDGMPPEARAAAREAMTGFDGGAGISRSREEAYVISGWNVPQGGTGHQPGGNAAGSVGAFRADSDEMNRLGGTEAYNQQITPRYETPEQAVQYIVGLDHKQLQKLQLKLYTAGFFGNIKYEDIRWGQRDRWTREAFFEFLKYAALETTGAGETTAQPWWEILDELVEGSGGFETAVNDAYNIDASTGRQRGAGGEERELFIPDTPASEPHYVLDFADPTSLNELIERTFRRVLNKRPSEDDKRAFVATFHAMQKHHQVEKQKLLHRLRIEDQMEGFQQEVQDAWRADLGSNPYPAGMETVLPTVTDPEVAALDHARRTDPIAYAGEEAYDAVETIHDTIRGR